MTIQTKIQMAVLPYRLHTNPLFTDAEFYVDNVYVYNSKYEFNYFFLEASICAFQSIHFTKHKTWLCSVMSSGSVNEKKKQLDHTVSWSVKPHRDPVNWFFLVPNILNIRQS